MFKFIKNAINVIESNRFSFAMYVPVIIGLKTQQLQYSNALANELLKGIEMRFGAIIDPFHANAVPYYVAMVTNSQFK